VVGIGLARDGADAGRADAAQAGRGAASGRERAGSCGVSRRDDGGSVAGPDRACAATACECGGGVPGYDYGGAVDAGRSEHRCAGASGGSGCGGDVCACIDTGTGTGTGREAARSCTDHDQPDAAPRRIATLGSDAGSRGTGRIASRIDHARRHRADGTAPHRAGAVRRANARAGAGTQRRSRPQRNGGAHARPA